MYTDIDSPELEAAIARAEEEQVHIDSIKELLTEASPEEKRAIATLAVANIDLAISTQEPYVIACATVNCTILVKKAYCHIRHIGESKKSAIALEILTELFPPEDDDFSPDPNEEDDDEEDGDEEEEGDEAVAAALAAERDFAAFRAEAIASR